MRLPPIPADVPTDAAAIAGATLIAVGFALAWLPLALFWVGGVLIAVSWLVTLGRERGG